MAVAIEQPGEAPETRVLLEEIERYLRVVEAYRQAGCEPRWLPEREPSPRP